MQPDKGAAGQRTLLTICQQSESMDSELGRGSLRQRGMTGWGEGHAAGRAVKSMGVVIPLAVQSSLVASHQPLMLVPFVVILQPQQPAEVLHPPPTPPPPLPDAAGQLSPSSQPEIASSVKSASAASGPRQETPFRDAVAVLVFTTSPPAGGCPPFGCSSDLLDGARKSKKRESHKGNNAQRAQQKKENKQNWSRTKEDEGEEEEGEEEEGERGGRGGDKCYDLPNNKPLRGIRMIAVPGSSLCCTDSFCQQQVGGHSSRGSPCHGVNGDLCLMQALLQAWQVGQGGHHASPQGSTDVTDASAYPVKVKVSHKRGVAVADVSQKHSQGFIRIFLSVRQGAARQR
ncbi:MAG: hypothetical protein FRX49_05953 [Trebouxia sp. A1-2]|nr:MAG: hypothetical protein FRX49_05953 [Trebouxia sp. A1-2]